jgi:hypothetical protein
VSLRSDTGPEPASEASFDDIATGITTSAVDPCDGGYFVTMDTDAGPRRLTSGCSDAASDAGPNVASVVDSVCGEDYPCTILSACDGPASLVFQSYSSNSGANSFCVGVGPCQAVATYSDGDGGIVEGNAVLDFATFPRDGGAVGGQYSGIWVVVVDGSASMVPASGEFCVLYSPRL